MLIVDGLLVSCATQVNAAFRADVLVGDGLIRAIGPDAKSLAAEDCEILDANGAVVMPGFVQAHVHLCQTIFRGMADDLPLLDWLRQRVWPLEAAHSDDSLRASAELGIAEMLLAGTTTILDMGTTHGHDVIFDACDRLGIRAFSGKAMMDLGDGVPAKLRETTQESLAQSEALRLRWNGKSNNRLHYAFAPRFILSCSEKLLRGVAELAKSSDSIVHTHVGEHPEERRAVRLAFGHDDIDVLRSWGIAGPRAVFAHGVQLTREQMTSLALDGSRVVHCPSANLKLGSGIAPVAEMLRAGLVLGLGADGAACNNNLDPWTELRHAALLSKVRAGPTSLAAYDALRLATISGAKLLGIDDQVGSIEVGKRADIIVVSQQELHQLPALDPVATLVYATRATDVLHVVVDGKLLVKHRNLQFFDPQALRARVAVQAPMLMQRAGLA